MHSRPTAEPGMLPINALNFKLKETDIDLGPGIAPWPFRGANER
jgi:hypothetical protein